MMKKKLLILTLSLMLALSGCGQEDKSAGESNLSVESSTEQNENGSEGTAETSAKEENASASGETVAKQTVKEASTETKKESAKPDKAETTTAPEKHSDKKETAVSTEAPKPASTKAPASSSTGSSTIVKVTEPPKAEATKAPVSTKAPVAQSTPAPTAVPTAAPTQAPPHEHSWDGGSVTTAASCGSEGTMTYSCSCGETRTESIPATGAHNWVEEVYGEATCTGGAYAYKKCTICDATGEGWTVAALGHDVETYEKHGGDCVSPAQYGNTCRRCGADLGDTYGSINPGVHSWQTVTSEVFNEETFKWETVTGTYCGNGCGAIQ